MTAEDFCKIPLIIPTDILHKYSKEKIRSIQSRGTKVYILQERVKIEYQEERYEEWLNESLE